MGLLSRPAEKCPPKHLGETRQFRRDYYLEDERLTEIDKMGVQNVLTLRKNAASESR